MKHLLTSRFPLVVRAFTLAGLTLPFWLALHVVLPRIVPSAILHEWRWAVVGMAVFQVLFLSIFILRLKDIWIDEDYIYLSTLLRKAQAPLETITSIEENIQGRKRQINIIFGQPTEIGTKLLFIPYFSFSSFKKHPVTDEIRQHVRDKQQRMQRHQGSPEVWAH
jgi:hypothetical protein